MKTAPPHQDSLIDLQSQLDGELHTGDMLRHLYATDASVYREMPLAVAFPRTENDIQKLINYAANQGHSLIPRTAGTSLAGQVVGAGIVVDVSHHFNRILEIDTSNRRVRVEPGVVRDELNAALKPHGLLFGPETSTSNRAMIGGMVGNNSCGSNSLVYGSTRDHLLEIRGFLSDGSPVVFRDLSDAEFEEKCTIQNGLEGDLYKHIQQLLKNTEVRKEIESAYPKPSIKRRNTGYALDQLLHCRPFSKDGPPFNFCRLIAGSEGTLCFATEIILSLDPLPPAHDALICAHFTSVNEALRANTIALRQQPRASELIDKVILDCTKANIEQRKNRFFLDGDPGAILVVELAAESETELQSQIRKLIDNLQEAGLGYHFPVLRGDDIPKVWNLRKAGLGLLSNVPGDAKPVAVVEDTAVDPEELPRYIEDYDRILESMNLKSVYYAHAGSGEIHIRPVLDLKKSKGREQFREVAERVAALVKTYNGSLSGEHGDGRLRGEFIAFMMGEKVTSYFQVLKATWDPHAILNPGKIVHAPPMDTNLRFSPDQETPGIETYFDFSETHGILRASEMCNGSGDCRKSHLAGGTMCPSFQATRSEKDTTRARANILREILTGSKKQNRFDSEEIREVMDLCLSCKGCKSECPSNVDISRMKAEFLQHYHDANGTPFRSRFFADFEKNQKWASAMAPLANFLTQAPGVSQLMKRMLGIHPNRSLPLVASQTLRKWIDQHPESLTPTQPNGKSLVLFIDEFTNYLDVELGKATLHLLTELGYRVHCPQHVESGRAALSKGLVRMARDKIRHNTEALAPVVSDETPLVGIEPSAIYTFCDEAPDLVGNSLKPSAQHLSENTLLIDEFLARGYKRGDFDSSKFTSDQHQVLLHGHCHQKAIRSIDDSRRILSIPEGHTVQVIPSGCCGMAGSFGYESEHYLLSMEIGKLVLFPAVSAAGNDVIIAAPGTSCRHQIADGTGKTARHPVEILRDALTSQTNSRE